MLEKHHNVISTYLELVAIKDVGCAILMVGAVLCFFFGPRLLMLIGAFINMLITAIFSYGMGGIVVLLQKCWDWSEEMKH